MKRRDFIKLAQGSEPRWRPPRRYHPHLHNENGAEGIGVSSLGYPTVRSRRPNGRSWKPPPTAG